MLWCEKKKKFIEGVHVVSSKLSEETFESNLKRIYECFRASDGDMSLLAGLETNYAGELSAEEIRLADKTFLYIVQRLDLFLLSPGKLQSDLTDLGFAAEKAEILVKFYSEATREIVKNLQTEESADDEVAWETKTTLADDTSLRCKKPAVRLSLKTNNQELTFDNLGRAELSTLFDKFENIQKELDALAANKS